MKTIVSWSFFQDSNDVCTTARTIGEVLGERKQAVAEEKEEFTGSYDAQETAMQKSVWELVKRLPTRLTEMDTCISMAIL